MDESYQREKIAYGSSPLHLNWLSAEGLGLTTSSLSFPVPLQVVLNLQQQLGPEFMLLSKAVFK